LFSLPLKKPQGTTTYCYTPAEVQAMIAHCFGRAGLVWLGEVMVALATTGLRISELAALRWTDLDLEAQMLRLVDTRLQGRKADRAAARTTKSHRDRTLPINPQLRQVLRDMRRHADGRIFHGPLGGRLKPDTVRTVLIREVLMPLAERFPSVRGEAGFRDGRLHSYRHYFCSMSANSGVPEQVLMTWLGHRDSKMVRRYYHLHQEEARRQMARIDFIGPLPNRHQASRQEPSQGQSQTLAERQPPESH
jgi:integrase